MITLKQQPFVDIFMTVANFFEIDTKANLQSHCDELDIYLPAKLRKADFARSLAKHFECNPLFTYNRLPQSEKDMIAELLSVPSKKYITSPRNDSQFLKIQKVHLVVTYEEATTWRIYMPSCIRKVLNEALNKDTISEAQNVHEMMKDLPDFTEILSKYPVRAQAAIYLILEEVNMLTLSTLPLTDYPSYDYDIDLLVKSVMQKKSDKELRIPLTLLSMDLKSTLAIFKDTIHRHAKSEAHSMESPLDLISYGTLLHALHDILTLMSKKTPSEVKALLNDFTVVDGQPYFGSIERISTEILSGVIGNLSRFVESENGL